MSRPPQLYEHEGLTLSVREWAELLGIARTTLYTRLRKSWPLSRALRHDARLLRAEMIERDEVACPCCHQFLPVSEFNVSRGHVGGINPYCKKCQKYKDRWHKSSPGRKKRMREWQRRRYHSDPDFRRKCLDSRAAYRQRRRARAEEMPSDTSTSGI